MKTRVGVFRVGSLGDHLIALPLYRRLRELHANDELILFSNVQEPGNPKKVGPAAVLPPGLFDAIRDYPVGLAWRESLAKLRLFRSIGLQRLYYLMPLRSPQQLRRDRLFFALAGVRVIGMNGSREDPVPRVVAETGLYEHETDRLARAIGPVVGDTPKTARYRSLGISPAERAEARRLLQEPYGSMVALSLGTKITVNDWGIDNWSELVRRLSTVRSIDRLVVLGSADESAASETLRDGWSGRFLNLCGRLSARQSAAVLSESRLFIGHDSGPMHMAAAVDVPIVAIFSARNLPGVWFPLSERSHVHYSRIECMGCARLVCEDRRKECIRRITAHEVFESCLAQLGEPAMAHGAPLPSQISAA